MTKEFKTKILEIDSQAELNVLFAALFEHVSKNALKYPHYFSEEDIKQMSKEEYGVFEKLEDLILGLDEVGKQ